VLPAGAGRTTIRPAEFAAVIASSSGTTASGAETPRLPVGCAYGTGAAIGTVAVVPPTFSCSSIDPAFQRLIVKCCSAIWAPGTVFS